MASFDPGYGYRAGPWSAGGFAAAPLFPRAQTSGSEFCPSPRVPVGLDHGIVTCLQEHDGWYKAQKLRLRNQELLAEVLRLRKRLGHGADAYFEDHPTHLSLATQRSVTIQTEHHDTADDSTAAATDVADLQTKLDRARQMVRRAAGVQQGLEKRRDEQELLLEAQARALAERSLDFERRGVDLKTKDAEITTLKAQLTRVTAAAQQQRAPHPDETKMKRLRHKAEQLQAENRALKARYSQVQVSNDGLTREVSSLDREFFEELEDLKFAYQQADRLNEAYEKALHHMAARFGVSLPADLEAQMRHHA